MANHGDPAATDRIFLCAVRLPAGEFPYMRDAVDDAASTMNAVMGESVVMGDYAVESVGDSDLETALRILGLWTEDMVRKVGPTGGRVSR